jgi:prepilin-type N-terminal cleavage/methylation domain-containing protein
MRKISHTHNHKKAQQGFTLVELLVSIAIFSVITTMAVFNNAQFNSSVLLTNLAYEVAISIRQSQVYGVTVRKNAAGSFDSAYGVHFDMNTPTAYTLFEDKPTINHICDASECGAANVVEAFSLQKGNRITKVCVDTVCTNRLIDISFVRPNPDAYIRVGTDSVTSFGKAEICISSPKGVIRKIVVEQTGQIAVAADASGICSNGSYYTGG